VVSDVLLQQQLSVTCVLLDIMASVWFSGGRHSRDSTAAALPVRMSSVMLHERFAFLPRTTGTNQGAHPSGCTATCAATRDSSMVGGIFLIGILVGSICCRLWFEPAGCWTYMLYRGVAQFGCYTLAVQWKVSALPHG
jgi:hypothetical protein